LQDTTKDQGTQAIGTINVIDGKFSYDWTPQAGNHSLTASWTGVKGESLSATSSPTLLYVEPRLVTLDASLSGETVTLGQNVTISVKLSEMLSNGTITIQYSLNNKTWNDLGSFTPKDGTFEYSWPPSTAATYYIQVKYSGSGNFGAAASNILVLYVKPP